MLYIDNKMGKNTRKYNAARRILTYEYNAVNNNVFSLDLKAPQ